MSDCYCQCCRITGTWLNERDAKIFELRSRVRELEEELAKAYKGAEQGWNKYYKMEEKYGKQ